MRSGHGGGMRNLNPDRSAKRAQQRRARLDGAKRAAVKAGILLTLCKHADSHLTTDRGWVCRHCGKRVEAPNTIPTLAAKFSPPDEVRGVGFPSIRRLTEALGDVSREMDTPTPPDPDGFDQQGLEVRLQVVDGSWQLHTGDPQYDTDYRGVWGAGALTGRESVRETRDLAKQLIEEARDQMAMSK